MSDKVAPYVAGSPVSTIHSDSRPYRTLRESIHHAAHGFSGGMKALAMELDFAPSALSMATVISEGENARPFPAEKLIELCRITGNTSPLHTLAEALGYEVRRRDDLHAIAADLDRHARSLRGER